MRSRRGDEGREEKGRGCRERRVYRCRQRRGGLEEEVRGEKRWGEENGEAEGTR